MSNTFGQSNSQPRKRSFSGIPMHKKLSALSLQTHETSPAETPKPKPKLSMRSTLNNPFVTPRVGNKLDHRTRTPSNNCEDIELTEFKQLKSVLKTPSVETPKTKTVRFDVNSSNEPTLKDISFPQRIQRETPVQKDIKSGPLRVPISNKNTSKQEGPRTPLTPRRQNVALNIGKMLLEEKGLRKTDK